MGSDGISREMMSAPPSASARAIACPRPPVPPVTMAVRPSKENRDVMSGGAVDIFAVGTSTGRGLRRLDESIVNGDPSIETAPGQKDEEVVDGVCSWPRQSSEGVCSR